MIQTELQLGNYVYLINRNHEVHLPIEIPQRISKIALFDVQLDGYTFSDKEPIVVSSADISPIPLTEDILIRCGFEKKGHVYRIDKVRIDFFESNVMIHIKGVDMNYEENKIEINGIKMLHQLQNLVKLLCNQTIELK